VRVPSHLVVDGYNVIHALPRFSEGGSLEEKRDRLQKTVELFAQVEGMDWTICFDGRRTQRREGKTDPHLAFSKGEGADALMERLAYQAKGREQIVCVTNDRTLRNFLFGSGASVISAEEFEDRLQQIERRLKL